MTLENLEDILKLAKPSIELKKHEEELFEIIPALKKCKDFNQNNPWHPYTVLDHIYHVVDNVDNEPNLRLAALFHDIGKSIEGIYQEDESGIGHFYNHWVESNQVFLEFASNNNMAKSRVDLISKLIFYHDKGINLDNAYELAKLLNIFTKDEIIMLFKLKRADILAQNQDLVNKYDLYNKYDNQENELIKKY